MRRFDALCAILYVLTSGLAACTPLSSQTSAVVTSQRITMAALHEAGGVPPGWRFSPPPGDVAAGRQAFIDEGCSSCHTIRDQGLPGVKETQPGPELTGMGAHHPAEYFAESILNPNAVLVEGPGYIGTDGRSTMPEYPDMKLQELSDLVAFISSLKQGGHDHGHHFSGGRPPLMTAPPPGFPPPPQGKASSFLVRVYEIREGQIEAFERWFTGEALPALLACDGLVSVETYVDHVFGKHAVFYVLGFTGEAALDAFLRNPKSTEILTQQMLTARPVDDYTFLFRPLYKVDKLSSP